MPFQVRVSRNPEFVLVEVSGPASMSELATLIATMSEQTKAAGDKRAVVDLQGVVGTLSFTDHFQIGHYVSRQMRHLERLASIVPPDKITRTSEKVATSMGMNLRVFTRLEDALNWIVE
ncbi:MAG: STAS/SEC14 domain-containing protein [Burkholderiales bacterium]|nr:MAG: STAS/SEC14 domain-containing protein [Burkholderiales bacterium]